MEKYFLELTKSDPILCLQAGVTPGIRPNASGAATVSPDGKHVGKNLITNLIIIIKVCYLLYIL